MHFDKFQSIVNHWWKFYSNQTRIRSFLQRSKNIGMTSEKLYRNTLNIWILLHWLSLLPTCYCCIAGSVCVRGCEVLKLSKSTFPPVNYYCWWIGVFVNVNLDYFGGRNIAVSQVLHKHFHLALSETNRLRLVIALTFWTFWRHFYGQ